MNALIYDSIVRPLLLRVTVTLCFSH